MYQKHQIRTISMKYFKWRILTLSSGNKKADSCYNYYTYAFAQPQDKLCDSGYLTYYYHEKWATVGLFVVLFQPEWIKMNHFFVSSRLIVLGLFPAWVCHILLLILFIFHVPAHFIYFVTKYYKIKRLKFLKYLKMHTKRRLNILFSTSFLTCFIM